MSTLEAALFARVPAEDLQLLLVGSSQQGSNLGPFFKWGGALRAAFANAESYSEASSKWGAVSRRLMTACLRNKTTASLKVKRHSLLGQGWGVGKEQRVVSCPLLSACLRNKPLPGGGGGVGLPPRCVVGREGGVSFCLTSACLRNMTTLSLKVIQLPLLGKGYWKGGGGGVDGGD